MTLTENEKTRLAVLLEKQKTGNLTEAEKKELKELQDKKAK